ncbi:MAG: ATP synthase subunit I, partial [Bryobacteraceae bacterium]
MDLERAISRIGRWMLGIAAAGWVAAFVAGGWRMAGGFLLGSVVSWLNYHWMKKLVNALGEQREGEPPPPPVSAVFLGMRYVLLGGGAY